MYLLMREDLVSTIFVYLNIWGLPIITLSIFLWFLTFKREYVFILLLGCVPSLFNIGIKDWIGRSRPDDIYALIESTGYSFPSGHAVFVVAFYGIIIYVLNHFNLLSSKIMLYILNSAIVLFMVAICFSRLYLGVHWPSDILSGISFSGFYLGVLFIFTRNMQVDSL